MRSAERFILARALVLCIRAGAYANWLAPRIIRRLKKIGGRP